MDAAALCKMADRGQITGGVVDGPLAFDNAVSEEAAQTKRIASPVAGRADILVVPDLEAGNMLAKQFEYMAEAQGAGIVLGAGADRADQPRRQADVPDGVLRDRPAPGTPGQGGPDMMPVIAVLNAGSSSVKFSVFAIEGAGLQPLFRGKVDRIGAAPVSPSWTRPARRSQRTNFRPRRSEPRRTPSITCSAG